MKEKKKKRGGKRTGAGRKPSGRQNEAVTVYTDVSRFGGRAGARIAIYEFLDGKITDTGKKAFLPLDAKDFAPSDREIKQKAPKEAKRPVVHLNKPISSLEPQEQPGFDFSTDSPPKTLGELKSRCPAELKGIDRSMWISEERQKYGI
jgi:hypothetical protein